MTSLTKLRPGAFGLLIGAVALSAIGQTIFKGASPPRISATDTQSNVSQAVVTDVEGEGAIAPGSELTYYQYQVDTELDNLVKQIRAAARDGLDNGATIESVNAALYDLTQQPSSAAVTTQKLVLLRQLQSLEDGEAIPTVEPTTLPTVEGYQNELTTD